MCGKKFFILVGGGKLLQFSSRVIITVDETSSHEPRTATSSEEPAGLTIERLLGGRAPRDLAESTDWGSTMHNEFTAIIEGDGDSFIAYCSEIPGADGQGRAVDQARASLGEAIALVLEDRRKEGPRVPRTRSAMSWCGMKRESLAPVVRRLNLDPEKTAPRPKNFSTACWKLLHRNWICPRRKPWPFSGPASSCCSSWWAIRFWAMLDIPLVTTALTGFRKRRPTASTCESQAANQTVAFL